jgi:hypothetical protein
MSALLNAVFRKVPEGYIAWAEEILGANVQADISRMRRQFGDLWWRFR